MNLKLRIEKTVKWALGRFGYDLIRPPKSTFDVQRELITAEEPVILDIGAFVGEIAREYRSRFPLATIHCFEPLPKSFETLLRSMDGDPRTTCHNLAVTDSVGTGLLNANKSPSTSSLLPTDEAGASFWGEGLLETTEQVEVETTTVDAFCGTTGTAHVDILKMDVQGAEFEVLSGAGEMLRDQRISLIYTELITCPTYEGQHELHEYLSLLASRGYGLLDFFNPARKESQLIQADVVFVSDRFREELASRR